MRSCLSGAATLCRVGGSARGGTACGAGRERQGRDGLRGREAQSSGKPA